VSSIESPEYTSDIHQTVLAKSKGYEGLSCSAAVVLFPESSPTRRQFSTTQPSPTIYPRIQRLPGCRDRNLDRERRLTRKGRIAVSNGLKKNHAPPPAVETPARRILLTGSSLRPRLNAFLILRELFCPPPIRWNAVRDKRPALILRCAGLFPVANYSSWLTNTLPAPVQ